MSVINAYLKDSSATKLILMDEVASWTSLNPQKEFEKALSKGDIIQDGKNQFNETLYKSTKKDYVIGKGGGINLETSIHPTKSLSANHKARILLYFAKALHATQKEPKRWFTTDTGTHIPVYGDESNEEASKNFFSKKNDKTKNKKLPNPKVDVSVNAKTSISDKEDWHIQKLLSSAHYAMKEDLEDYVYLDEDHPAKIKVGKILKEARSIQDKKFEDAKVTYKGVDLTDVDKIAETGKLSLDDSPSAVTLNHKKAADYGNVVLTIPKDEYEIGSPSKYDYENNTNFNNIDWDPHYVGLWEYRLKKGQKLKSKLGIKINMREKLSEEKKEEYREKYKHIGDVEFGTR